ncbi:MAG: hypothetical protein KAS63_03885 [Candidatus Heimdallarchaeota archaeon]|nr:hypothetical protein [Candidatus Heimdallarchaeota archaeon]MCK4954474.1 hypothetical protein [Candidatus Heimdallarchaeota archaeon]
MFQVIARRKDEIGYYIYLSDIPNELSEDSIVFMPELSTKELQHIKYVSKYTHKSGNIIVKLVRSDGFDQFGRPKSLSHSLVIPSEEYNLDSLNYFASPLFKTDYFDEIHSEPGLLDSTAFERDKNTIIDEIEPQMLREIIVAAMIEPKVILFPNLELKQLIDLASVIDKAIPYEASYDFSLLTYSDRSCSEFLVHNVLYFFSKDVDISKNVYLKKPSSRVSRIAEEEKEYLDDYISLIVNEEYEELLQEHAKWTIGMHHNEHKDLQKHFTNRYQLNTPFSRRNKFHAQLVKSLSLFYS